MDPRQHGKRLQARALGRGDGQGLCLACTAQYLATERVDGHGLAPALGRGQIAGAAGAAAGPTSRPAVRLGPTTGRILAGETVGTFLLMVFGFASSAVGTLFDSYHGLMPVAVAWGAGVVGALTAYLCGRLPGARVSLVDTDASRETLAAALGAGHPLAARETIHADDLDPKALLLLADGHCLRDQALEFCGHPERGETAGADIRATSLETLLHLTAANYGITLVPRLAVGNDIGLVGKLETRPLEGEHHFRRVRLVHRANTPRQQALALLAGMIRKGVPEGVERLDG